MCPIKLRKQIYKGARMLADILVGAVGFGAIGYLFAKPFTDIFAEKMVGGIAGFLVGLVIMGVIKATRSKRIK